MNQFDDSPITNADDLVWLADRQPRRGAPTADATDRARQALLAHAGAATEATSHSAATGSEATTPAPAPAGFRSSPAAPFSIAPVPARRRWVRRGALGLASTAVAAVAITLGLGALPTGNGPTSSPHVPLAPAAAQAAPLLRLTHQLSAAAPATGDATLTVKHTTLDNGHVFEGYDLVTDGSLKDYFSQDRAGLATAVPDAGAATPGDTGPGTIHAWLAAAAASNADSPAGAAKRINDASGIPIPAAPAGKDPAAFHQAQYVNHVWITALSAIELDGGRPDVRAGALLAMYGVGAKINQTTVDGRNVIEVVMTQNIGGSPYEETLTIDATTGIPITYVGGSNLPKPATSITYDVSRVDAADFGH